MGDSAAGALRAGEGPFRTDPATGLPLPRYDGRSLPNLASTVARACGASPDGPIPLAPPLSADLDPFGGRAPEGPVVVLLVDGFGWHAFDRWWRSASTGPAAAWGRYARPISTVFPSTTTPALVALSSGTPPSQSGVVGYRQFLPRFGVVADLLRMTPVGVRTPETLVGPDWRPELLSGTPSIFRRGAGGVALSRDRFEGSGLTRTLYDGAEYVPYTTASDFAHLLGELVGRARPPRLVYAYWDELDTVHHVQGPSDRLFAFEAERLAHLIGYVARQVDASTARATTIVVTADHGQVPLESSRQLRVDLDPELLAAMGRPLAGDRRAGYFAAAPGRETELRAALDRFLPIGSQIVSVPDAIDAGWFGPPPYHPELRARLGDWIALVPEPYGLTSVPPGGRAEHLRVLKGGHGGLTPTELAVPLVAGPLAELGRS